MGHELDQNIAEMGVSEVNILCNAGPYTNYAIIFTYGIIALLCPLSSYYKGVFNHFCNMIFMFIILWSWQQHYSP